jgi:PAS domain S-box-containing protein
MHPAPGSSPIRPFVSILNGRFIVFGNGNGYDMPFPWDQPKLTERMMERSDKANITRRLVLIFAISILIFSLYGLFAIYDLNAMSRLAQKIYMHPLVVSNAALQSNAVVAKMHRNMKDVVLLASSTGIQKTIDAVNFGELQVYRNLDLIKKSIIGEEGRALERASRDLFEQWRPIRDEVIRLARLGRKDEAAEMTTGKGAAHVGRLEEKMLDLALYARNKASVFMAEVEKTHSAADVRSMVFLSLGVFTSILIAFFTLKDAAAAEKELVASRKLLAKAFDFAPIGMALVAMDSRFFKVNRALAEMVGYSERELLKMTFREITHPEDYRIGSDVDEKLILGDMGKADLEKRCVKKSGHVIHVFLTTSLIRNDAGDPQYFFTQIQEMTEQKKAARALRDSEQLLNEMGRIARIGAWEHDLVSGQASWSQETYRIVEIDSKTVPGPDAHLEYYPPEDREILSAAYLKAVETGEQFDLELRCITAKGRLIWVRAIGRPEFRAGRCVKMRGTFQDISARKHAEPKR